MITQSWKNATPEQILLWNYASTLIAYTTITPLVYHGLTLGSEFVAYLVTKLYIALEIELSTSSPPAGAAYGNYFNDELNNNQFFASNNCTYWDGAAIQFAGNNVLVKNIYFSCIDMAVMPYTTMRFVGYRLDII